MLDEDEDDVRKMVSISAKRLERLTLFYNQSQSQVLAHGLDSEDEDEDEEEE